MSLSPGTRMLMSLCGVCDWEEARVVPSDSSQFDPKKENKQHKKREPQMSKWEPAAHSPLKSVHLIIRWGRTGLMHALERYVTCLVAGWKGAMWIAPLSACMALLFPRRRGKEAGGSANSFGKKSPFCLLLLPMGCLEGPEAAIAHLKIKPKGKNTGGEKLYDSKPRRRRMALEHQQNSGQGHAGPAGPLGNTC